MVDHSTLKYCKLLNNDDLILITTIYIHILSFNNQSSKIAIKYIKEIHSNYDSEKERLKQIKTDIEKNNIDNYLFDFNVTEFYYSSYIDGHQISRQPYKEMILYMLDDLGDLYNFKHGEKILGLALNM